MPEKIMVQPHNRVLCSHNKEWGTVMVQLSEKSEVQRVSRMLFLMYEERCILHVSAYLCKRNIRTINQKLIKLVSNSKWVGRG